MDQALNNALKRQAEIAAISAKAAADMAEVTAFILSYHRMHDLNSSKTAAHDHQPAPPRIRRPAPASKEEVLASVKVAREVIGQQNRPVQISELYQEVTARGFVIKTPKPVLTYGARLRDYRKQVGLTYLDGLGWWPVERPYPQANYNPANALRVAKQAF